MDIVAQIAEGRTVLQARRFLGEPEIIGYGPASDLIGAPVGSRICHFYWPDPYDEEQCAEATIVGASTPAKREAIERKALEVLTEIGREATTLIWRLEPTWESEREFDTQTERHKLATLHFPYPVESGHDGGAS